MVETKPLRIISRTEVSKNNSEASLWVIVGNHVYDLTIFLDKHPGKLGFLYGEPSKKVNFSIFGRFFQIFNKIALWLYGFCSWKRCVYWSENILIQDQGSVFKVWQCAQLISCTENPYRVIGIISESGPQKNLFTNFFKWYFLG